jgi:hypothetical protein
MIEKAAFYLRIALWSPLILTGLSLDLLDWIGGVRESEDVNELRPY